MKVSEKHEVYSEGRNVAGAKAPSDPEPMAARLKPCPDTAQHFSGSKPDWGAETHPDTSPGFPTEAETAMVSLNWRNGAMHGTPVQEKAKRLGELKGIFRDEAAWQAMDPAREIYRVRWWAPVAAGEEGGLFWGVTILQPGKVGEEYFMTHGHIHADRTRAEYYTAVAGTGILVRMDEERRTWGEAMSPGTLHYIRGAHAHRVVNVGDEPLIFWACWGSDAGYDYGTIQQQGFGAAVVERDGEPVIVAHE